MATRFTPAPTVEAVARPLIAEFHEHLIKHQVRIDFLFFDAEKKRNGKTVWGYCQKIGSLAAFLAGEEEHQDEGMTEPFFVICIWETIWRSLKPEQKKALVDHELAHAGAEYDDKGKTRLVLRGHDLEEFNAIYGRYGAWRQGIIDFLNSGNLFDDSQTSERKQTTEEDFEYRRNGRRNGTEAEPIALPDPMAPLALPGGH